MPLRNLPPVLRLAALCLVFALPAASANGEEMEAAGEGTFRGFVLAGLQSISGWDGETAKFEEYRSMTEGAVLPELRLQWDSGDGLTRWELHAFDVGRLDQRLSWRFGALGLWDLELVWNRTPHRLYDSSRLLYEAVAPNEFRLPAEVQAQLASLAGDDAAVSALFDGLAREYPLGMREDTFGVHFSWRPAPDWRVRLGYEREEQRGEKIWGGTITFFDANEIPEPVDWTTDRIDASLEWAVPRGFASVALAYSSFREGYGRVIWDQPFIPEVAGSSFQGAAALPPDNRALDLTLSGGVHWGRTHRLTAMLSYGSWTQDEAFLAPTINEAIAAPELPRRDLDGKIANRLVDIRYTSRPHDRVGIHARFRRHELDNKTERLVFEDVVRSDDALRGEPYGTIPVGYRRKEIEVGLDVRLARRVDLGLGYELEDLGRELREVASSEEKRWYLTLDARPVPELSLRLRGETGERRYDDYDQARVLQYLLPEEELDDLFLEVAPDQRKYDEANRDRDEVEASVFWDPHPKVYVGGTWSYRANRYGDTVLGLLNERSTGVALDFAYRPHDRVRLYANWARETYVWDEAQRYRRVFRGVPTDDPEDDWFSHDRDRVVSWGLGMHAVLVEDRLDWNLDWVRSYAGGLLSNEWVPGGRDEANDVEDFPEVTTDLARLETTFRWLLSQAWDVRFGWLHEEYEEADFQLDAMDIYMGGFDPSGGSTRSNFLGTLTPAYDADLLSVLVGFRW